MSILKPFNRPEMGEFEAGKIDYDSLNRFNPDRIKSPEEKFKILSAVQGENDRIEEQNQERDRERESQKQQFIRNQTAIKKRLVDLLQQSGKHRITEKQFYQNVSQVLRGLNPQISEEDMLEYIQHWRKWYNPVILKEEE